MCDRAELPYTVPKPLSPVHCNDGTMKAAPMKNLHNSESVQTNLMNLMSQCVTIGSKIGTEYMVRIFFPGDSRR